MASGGRFGLGAVVEAGAEPRVEVEEAGMMGWNVGGGCMGDVNLVFTGRGGIVAATRCRCAVLCHLVRG